MVDSEEKEGSRPNQACQPYQRLRQLFFMLVVRPVMQLAMGIHVRNYERLTHVMKGPMILVANHNSHMDVFALSTLFTLKDLNRFRPVAAADYFMTRRFLRWFSVKLVGIIPLERQIRKGAGHPLAGLFEALDRGEIVVLFPEGTRGEPELRGPLQAGIAHISKKYPQVPILPIFMHGLGRALPKGEIILVPMTCKISIGEAIYWPGDKDQLLSQIDNCLVELSREVHVPPPTSVQK